MRPSGTSVPRGDFANSHRSSNFPGTLSRRTHCFSVFPPNIEYLEIRETYLTFFELGPNEPTEEHLTQLSALFHSMRSRNVRLSLGYIASFVFNKEYNDAIFRQVVKELVFLMGVPDRIHAQRLARGDRETHGEEMKIPHPFQGASWFPLKFMLKEMRQLQRKSVVDLMKARFLADFSKPRTWWRSGTPRPAGPSITVASDPVVQLCIVFGQLGYSVSGELAVRVWPRLTRRQIEIMGLGSLHQRL